MPTYYEEAPDEVIELAQEIIDKHHPWLKTAHIGFIMRDKAQKSSGRVVLGTAQKVSAKLHVHLNFDFIIELAKDEWEGLTSLQRRALIDHELCHCGWDGFNARMRGHDIEEFHCIFERYGFWRPRGSRDLADAVQVALELPIAERVDGVGKVPVGAGEQELLHQLREIMADGTTIEVIPAAGGPHLNLA